jgi:SAM-dependent methyltransferase
MIKTFESFYRKIIPKKLKTRMIYQNRILDKSGLEIGGPSEIFQNKGVLPLYEYARKIDGCNFSDKTVWEGLIEEGDTYSVSRTPGRQYVAEGTDLDMIKDESYDFILSCHNLEHVANPLKALYEWKRLMKKDACLVLVLPHKDRTFDHNRPVTELKHIINDYNNDVGEDDETHLNEIMTLHDFDLENGVFDKQDFEERLKNNLLNRCAHHHVFNGRLTAALLDYAGFRLVDLSLIFHNIIVLADLQTELSQNDWFLSESHPFHADKKYPSDFSYSKHKQ